ncbi:NAD(P)-dependent oxidoreductase [Ensifer sp. ENS06]|nr:NAD(P)-dependent oxidoreductase [Ensifer sp. ENS06]
MADALARAGFAVTGWSRSVAEAPAGALYSVRASAMDAVRHAAAVVVCLRDQHVTEQVLFESGLASAIPRGAVVIDTGTTGPEVAKEHAAAFTKFGVFYLDAPVSGGTGAAEKAALSIFVGGGAEAFERGQPLLSAMGLAVHLGPAGAGQTAKLANQIIVGVTIAAVAEGLAFAERNGIAPRELIEALANGFAGSKVLEVHGPRMASRDFSAPGAIRLHLKDLRLAAQDDGLRSLLHAKLVKDGFMKLAAEGHDELDHSAYAKLYELQAEPAP